MESLVKDKNSEAKEDSKSNEDITSAPQIVSKHNAPYFPPIPHESEGRDESVDLEQVCSEENNNQQIEKLTQVPSERRCTKKRIIISVAFLIVASSLLVIGYIFEGKINSQLDIISDWVKNNQVAAYFIIITTYTIGIVLWIPGAIFLIFGSFIWGRVYGQLIGASIYMFIDFFWNLVGQALAFLNSRYLFKSCVQRWIQNKPKILALSLALSNNAKKLVALGRVSWITPYFVFNNIWGVTEMKFTDYLFGNLFTIICHTPFIFIFAGITNVTKLSSNPAAVGTGGYVILFVSISISLIIVIFVIIYARKEFKKHMASVEQSQSKNLVK